MTYSDTMTPHAEVSSPAVDPTTLSGVGLLVENIEVRYGHKTAVKDISFGVLPGQTTAVIGPSGCGKSTTLKAVAGLNDVAEGAISLNNRAITGISPAKRNIGIVPQSYAVFPHMSVRNNIAYGLKARRRPAAEVATRVNSVLELTRLTEFAERLPDQLSGGQRQRVALGRALAIEPEVLLLDEPLAALDPQLRGDLRRQLATIISEAGCGTLIVTHDQHEAMALAHHIAILEAGRLVQLGTPEDLWERPVNAFVADFLTNSVLLDAQVAGETVYLFNGNWQIPLSRFKKVDDPRNPQALIRPASLHIVSSDDPASVPAIVKSAEYAGGRLQALVSIYGQEMLLNTEQVVAPHDQLHVAAKSGKVSLIGGGR